MNFRKEGFSFDPLANFLIRRNGKEVGNVVKNSKGYDKEYVRVTWQQAGKRKSAYAHRIVWELHNGPVPEGMFIDHINGDGLDNRIENLRLATRTQNMYNRKCNAGKKDGLPKGIIINHGKYTARVTVDGVRHQKIGTDINVLTAWMDELRITGHKEFMNGG